MVLVMLTAGGFYYWQETEVKGVATADWKTYVNDYPYFTEFQFSYPRNFVLSAGDRLQSRFSGGGADSINYVDDKMNFVDNRPTVNSKILALNADLKVPLGEGIFDYKYDGQIVIEIHNDTNKQIIEENHKVENNPVGTILKSDEYSFEEIIEINGQKLLRRIAPEGLEGRYWDNVIFHDDEDVQYILSTPLNPKITLDYIKQNETQKLSPVFNQIVSTFRFIK